MSLFKNILKISLILFITIYFIYNNFYYIDGPNHCSIRLKLSILEFSAGNIKQAIKVLKLVVPDEYQKLCQNVKIIDPNLACGGFQGGCYYGAMPSGNPNEISISTANQDYLGWTAAVIAHETCHAVQFSKKRVLDEQECYLVGHKVLAAIAEF